MPALEGCLSWGGKKRALCRTRTSKVQPVTSLLLPRGQRGVREKVAKQGPSWGCLPSPHCPLPSRPEHLTFLGRIISIPTLGPGGQVELTPFRASGLGIWDLIQNPPSWGC